MTRISVSVFHSNSRHLYTILKEVFHLVLILTNYAQYIYIYLYIYMYYFNNIYIIITPACFDIFVSS